MTSLSALELLYCAVILLFAYALRGSTGFGTVIGMPLLALVLPLKLLVPVWSLLGFASSLAILGRDHRHVARGAFIAFVPWCVLGIVAGLYFFAMLDARALTRSLGAFVIAYAGYALWRALRPSAQSTTLPRACAPPAATLAGMVGALFGTMGSIFFVMYLDAHALQKDQFRATMAAMLLTLSAIRGAGYFAMGEFTMDSWLMFAAAFPATLLGVYAGDRIQLKLSERRFRQFVCAALFLCGAMLLLK